jgi:ABC-2 type transport system permease protein
VSALPRLRAVVRREYLERVRTKAFVITTVVAPLFMIGLTLVPMLLQARQKARPLRVAVLDTGGGLRGAVEAALARRRPAGASQFEVRPLPEDAAGQERDALRRAVLRGDLDGYLYLPADVLERSAAEYHGRNLSNLADVRALDLAVEEAVVHERLARAGLDRGRIAGLTRRLDLKTVRLTPAGAREDRGGGFLLTFVLMMMLYATTLMWGSAILNGVIEEKANRVVEVIVSSLPVWVLFLGKLLGVGAAGLTQFAVWAGCLLVLSLFGGAAAGSTAWPEVSALLVGSFVVCFGLGFFLYGAVYAAVGAAVNTQQEAQSLAFPVMMPLVMSVVFFPLVLRSPDSTTSVVLSMVPFFTPLLMFLRIASLTPPFWQLALALALSLLAIAGVTWMAARIYRVGILMYGKRATLPEILRWATRP